MRITKLNIALALALVAILAMGVAFSYTTNTIHATKYFYAPAGSASLPAITWWADRDSGFYWKGANNLGLTLGGTQRWDFGTATSALTGNLTVSGTITATGGVVGGVSQGTFADGSVAAPGITYTNETDSGFSRIGTANISLSLAGVKEVDFGAATIAFTDAITAGGGYGATGVTISTAGNIQANGTLTVDGASTLTSATTQTGEWQAGGGYSSTGVTVSTAGNVQAAGTLTVDGASTLTGATTQTAEWQAGGGYASTGVTVSTAGNIQAAGTLTVDGASTLTGDVTASGAVSPLTLVVGGGYGATGLSVAASGNLSTNGTLIVDAASTLTGATEISGGLTLDTTVFSIANTTGVISWVPTSTTAVAATFNGSTITSGTILLMKAVDATLNAGKYLDIQGGAGSTTVFSIAEDGATAITSTAVATNSFSITNNATTSGDLIILTADDDTLDGDTYYINALGGTASTTQVFYVGEGGVVGIVPTTAAAAVDSLYIGGILNTTGDLLQLDADDDILNGGLYINCLGGAAYNTAVFTVGEGGNTAIAGTLAVSGASRLAVASSVVDADDRTVTSADYGKMILLTHATASAVTLPANGAAAGSQFWVALNGNDSLAATISAATVDTLIGFNDAALDSVTWGAGHRIGAMAWFWSDGAVWHVQSIGSGTMTYTS